ncbi:Mandelate racemase/muconate lactonizing protein [Thermobaculum terrenum ATCC BAA-798]|uniref:Mandelate racemase/muconate lactonizing protein n=1 Tax=Thermobaculum terrenum (strain ATCC BAA-798 / CCMEE 7001 / YNP1) TaxID=525904 RepID=D1CI36_THET1|nr:mandelate racemase/muconate lactonizing enzyme family protein [Thermobaculum terrenum]ACZ43407.1 Mandelate racemase/muconate lactonizing protein [Thermobaculum terrenum ATCC BAA-798]
MRITDVEAIYLRLPEVDPSRADGTQDTLLVRVHTDEGITGVGEVDSSPLVARAAIEAPVSHSVAMGLKHVLLGENPLEIDRLWERMYRATIYFGRGGPAMHAMSGIDLALWDILGKATGLSVSELLGGARRHRLRAYASAIMPETPVEAGRLAEQYAAAGYTAVKFGWGPIGRSRRLDEELVQAIRSAVGEDVDVMIDAGMAWDLKGALRMAEVYERYGVYWLEEPLAPDDLEGYRQLADRTRMYIAAGEQESGAEAFRRLINEGHVDVVQPDLGRCGGLTEGRRIAQVVHARHRQLVPHAFKSGILVAASAHLAACIPGGAMIEYTVSTSPIARDLVSEPLELVDGHVLLPERPGLGVEVDESVVQRYRVA